MEVNLKSLKTTTSYLCGVFDVPHVNKPKVKNTFYCDSIHNTKFTETVTHTICHIFCDSHTDRRALSADKVSLFLSRVRYFDASAGLRPGGSTAGRKFSPNNYTLYSPVANAHDKLF